MMRRLSSLSSRSCRSRWWRRSRKRERGSSRNWRTRTKVKRALKLSCISLHRSKWITTSANTSQQMTWKSVIAHSMLWLKLKKRISSYSVISVNSKPNARSIPLRRNLAWSISGPRRCSRPGKMRSWWGMMTIWRAHRESKTWESLNSARSIASPCSSSWRSPPSTQRF